MSWGAALAIVVRNATTGVVDTTAYTMKLQPLDQAYDTGAIPLVQKSTDTYVWGLASDLLDDDTCYGLYKDGSDTGLRFWAPNARPPIGE